MSEFLKEPRPFKCSCLSFEPGEMGKPQLCMGVGVKLTTESPSGLKLVPMHEVAINLSFTGSGDEREFRIGSKWARELGAKLFEYASMCDQLNEADKA